MAQPHQNSVVLSKNEEKRLDDIFRNFAKSDPDRLKISEFFQLCMDRSLVSPKIGFSALYELILDCIGPNDLQEQQKDKAFNQQKERMLEKHQFHFILVQLSKWTYSTEQNHLERLIQDIISEKTEVIKDTIKVNRTPYPDDITKKLLTEQSIEAISEYEDELIASFVAYMSENYKKGQLLLKWEELALENKKMTCFALARFLNDCQVVPHSMSPETIQDIVSKVCPSICPAESDFYSKHRIIQIFDKDLDKGKEEPYLGDPKLAFYEFQLVIMRIAFEHYPKTDEKKTMEEIIHRFLKDVLGFRKNNELETEDFPKINKRVYERLNMYYQDLEDEENRYENQEEQQEEIELIEPLAQLAQLQQEKIFNAQPHQMDFQEMLTHLQKDLPPIPPIPDILQDNPPPYRDDKLEKKKKERFVIGDKLPNPPPDKNKQQKPKPPKKKQLKKGEKPPRQIIYADPPIPVDPNLQYNHLEKLNHNLVFGEKLLSNTERGTLTQIDVIPVIIEEILYPPECEPQITYLIEAAINGYNDSNFQLAIQNFDNAQVKWGQIAGNNGEIGDNNRLFFEYSKASVYASAGRDDYALNGYYNCKSLSDKLPYTNPDRSLAYCGLGSVFYNMEEYKLSLRSFLKAREIREKLHGVEHVDTATMYNNLGACMFMLERNQEAMAYFKIAHSIFEADLGPYHNRTMTAARNIKKTEKGYFENIPQFQTLWETYEQDPFKKSKKKKKKKKK